MSSKRLVIIDGKSVFYRGYYAMSGLRTSDNIPTGGVYGFATMAIEVIRRLNPEYIAVAWDKPKTNIRKRLKLYPEYKAGRKPAPPDFYEQIPILHELLEALGWPLYEMDDFEADDIMGTLAIQASRKGIETILITSDLDLLQLVSDNIKVYVLKTGLSNIELYSPKTFEAKHHLKVQQFLDLKALKGDSSDNIPGVSGIGEKTATDLLTEFNDLDNIYDNLALINPKVSEKLIRDKKMAYLSKELARIWTNAPIKLDLKAMDGSKLKVDDLIKLLNKLQFRSLVTKIYDIMPNVHKDDFRNKNPLIVSGELVLIDSLEKLNKITENKTDKAIIYFRSLKKHGKSPKYLILNFLTNNIYFVDIEKINRDKLIEYLKNIKQIIGYDLKNNLEVLLELGLNKLPKVIHDIQIADYLISPALKERPLSEMANSYLQNHFAVDDLDDREFKERAVQIVYIVTKIYEYQTKELSKLPKIKKLFTDIELPIIEVLSRMEKVGIKVDLMKLTEISREIDDLIMDLEQQIYGFANKQFNISSPSQLAEILFSKDNLNISARGIKKTKSGYSTAIGELLKIHLVHPIIELIIKYREVTKLKNTYVDTLPNSIEEDGRIHTTFSLTSAQTGRLSSINPNLQNIPIRSELGKSIRKAFVADKGKVLISLDYSQFELRLAAVLANDKELIEEFNRDVDIHAITAAQVYKRELEDVTEPMRRAAKIINFGILYGMSPHGLSIASSMTYEQASDFIKKYKEIRKPLFDYMENVLKNVRVQGYSETLMGRRRYFPEINSSNYIIRQASERAAINMPIQGTEAELMKLAMIKSLKTIDNLHNDCHILLQVHDSILVESPVEISDNVAELLKDCMENVYNLDVKLKVDVKIASNWGDL